MEFFAIAAAGVQAAGAIVSGIEQSNQLEFSARQNRNNAIYERQNATLENQLATADANAQRRRGRAEVAEQTTALSQSGFLINGDAASAIQDSAANAELDALNIQYRGVLRARQNIAQAEAYEAQARADKAAKKAMPLKTIIGAATSALTGYSNVRGMKIA